MKTIIFCGAFKGLNLFPKIETDGWDFGTQGSSTVLLSNMPWTGITCISLMVPRGGDCISSIEDTTTGKVVLQLSARFSDLFNTQWDGQHLVGNYESGELLILDFIHVFPQ